MIKRYCNRCEREVGCTIYLKGVEVDHFSYVNARDVLGFAHLNNGKDYDTCEACARSLQDAITDWYNHK